MPGVNSIKKLIIKCGFGLFLCLYAFTGFAANYPPAVGTINPSGGSSSCEQAVSFTTTFSDPDGWQNIKEAYLLFNTSANGARCFYGYYNRSSNKLYLRNDNNTSWLGGYSPASSYTIENSYTKLHCAQTSISGSGNTLTVSWSITFKSTFLGVKNAYLYVKDNSGLYDGFKQKGTWTITALLSISLNPKNWDIGKPLVNQTITMPQPNKITVTNNGSGPETFALALVNPSGWSAANTPGQNIYVLSGLFCNLNDAPQASHFNQSGSFEDVLATTSKKATTSVFGYSQATANGVAVPKNAARSLYLQFKSPANTDKANEQVISVIVSCQSP
jgi:hypothetical protein